MRIARLVALAAVLAAVVSPGAGALDIEQDRQPPDAEVGTPYSFQFLAEEGCPPSYRFSLSSGNLPPGLSITQEGKLTGIPTQAGVFDFFVQVEDGCSSPPSSEGYFKLKVLPDLAVATTSLPRAQPSQPYSTKLTPTNLEDGWSVTWAVLSGVLPPGLALAADGTISGTPAAAGKWAFVVRVQEQFRRFGDRELTIVVAAPLSLSAAGTQLGEVGVPFRTPVTPVGGLGPMSFAVTGGSLPPGLTLDPATGFVQGRPLSAGTFAVTFAVTDAGAEQATAAATLQIVRRLAIATTKLPGAEAGEAYSAVLSKAGGIGPFRWRIVRGAPAGLRLNAQTGRLSGVPRASGRFRITVEVRDRLGVRAVKKLVLTVRA